MSYTVVWLPAAEEELARIWLNSNDRHTITHSARTIDWKLSRSPEEAGESREQGRRILIVLPLAVIYRTLPQDRLVRVINVREIGHDS